MGPPQLSGLRRSASSRFRPCYLEGHQESEPSRQSGVRSGTYSNVEDLRLLWRTLASKQYRRGRPCKPAEPKCKRPQETFRPGSSLPSSEPCSRATTPKPGTIEASKTEHPLHPAREQPPNPPCGHPGTQLHSSDSEQLGRARRQQGGAGSPSSTPHGQMIRSKTTPRCLAR